MRHPHEFEFAGCREVGGDWWFPDKGQGRDRGESGIALSICRSCVHKQECADWGIANEEFGIWGGLPANQLDKIRKLRGITLERGSFA